jgi:hypothetical protein
LANGAAQEAAQLLRRKQSESCWGIAEHGPPVNWSRIAIAAVLPVFLALPVAWAFWRKKQAIIGNAVGAGILFMSAVLFAGADYVEFLRYRLGCKMAHLGCPLSVPSDFMKLSAYGIVAFIHPGDTFRALAASDDVKAVVIASSDKAYGDHDKLPYDETAPLIGKHPYDVSKSCTDLISLAYHKTYKLPVCVTRCGNFYGAGDLNFNRIVPGTIRSVPDA